MSNTLLSSKNPIVERVLGLSQRPMLVAVVAAIGIHGIVLVLLPALNQPKRPDDERVVDLVELPAGAQALLPNSSPPQFMLPPLQPDLPDVQFDRDFNISSLPNLQDPYNFSLDPLPPLPPPPQGGTVYIPSGPAFPYAPYPENKPPVQQPKPQQPRPAASPSPNPSPTTVAQASPTPSTTASPNASGTSTSNPSPEASPTATPNASPTPGASPAANPSPNQPTGSQTSRSQQRRNIIGSVQDTLGKVNSGQAESDTLKRRGGRQIPYRGELPPDASPPQFLVTLKNGQLIKPPELSKSSGNNEVDQEARRQLGNTPFSQDQTGIYPYEFTK